MAGAAIGILGAGRMGTALAKRLMETGHTVHIWNRTRARTAEAEKAGANVAGTLDELARTSEIILSSLTDFEALEAVYGGGGLLAQDIEGKLCIEMSTILPDEQVKLEERVRAAGAGYLECPVGGTVGPALKGQLLGFAGGTSADWGRGRPILETLCKRVELLGAVGAGSSMKLAVNLPLALVIGACLERA